MKNYRTELSQRVCYAIIAGMTGAFLIPQVGFAAPAGEHDYTAGVNVDRATANTTKITAKATNNVINWRDYSVNHGETVQYDGGNKTNNYLNIVTGANTSNINGKIEGGNNVYIVNPNGVIFGKGAEVNVGHLHVSTQDGVSSAAKTAFETGGTSPLDNTAALKADVVNMGKITATSVEVHGAHIRFLNAADVKTSGGTLSSVDMYTAPAASSATDPDGGYAHIGYRTAAAPTNYTVHTASVSPEYYKLVKDKTELDAINSSTATLAGKYMLEQDIDLGGAAHTPIGGNSAPGAFTGKFDGNFFRVQNFNVSNVDSAGFFGEVSNGRIENFGVAQANIVGKRDNSHQYAGGIVGHTAGTSILKNVYVTDTTKVEGRTGRYGGIVGSTGSTSSSSTDHTVIDGAYSRAVIGRDAPGNTGDFAGGGIVGHSGNTTDISNSYSVATNDDTDKTAAYFLYIITPNTTTTVKNSYGVVGTEFSSNDNALSSNGKAVDTYKINGNKAEKIGATGDHTANASSTYTNWDINNDGAPGAKWRIYEGRTLPLLTAFMNGRVDSVGSVGANYSYRKFNQTNGSAVAGDANKDPISNNHADITGLTYDSKIVKIVDGSGNVGDTSKVTYDKTLTGDQKNTVKMYTDTGTSLSKTDNIRNAGTKAILWSDQDGPNLRNVNVTIGQRKVTVANSNITVTRRYNGKIAVTNEYNAAIRNGGITAGGITTEDIADGSVTITTSTDFKAEMDDKNVGENKAVTLYGSLTFAGTDQSNYDITQSDFNFGSAGRRVDKVATITKAPLILKVTKDSTTKVYDGTDTVTEAAMSADPNIKLNETLRRTGETDAADIKSDDTNNKDDVSINYANIGSPTYIKSDGSAEVHAGTHKIRYKNVELQGNDKDNYELYYQMPDTTQKKVASNQIDLKGEITRRRITTNDFKVYEKGTNAPVEATKIYDGNNEYAPTNVYLSTDENGATGIVRRDKGYITFAMKDGKGHFIDNDTTKNKTKNVKEATRVSYTVTGVADSTKDTDGQPLYRLSDYYVLDAGGVTKNDLNVGFAATGAGRITPKLLTANVVKNHIEKTYDGWADQTDGNRNKTVGDPLVTLSGWVAGDTARTNTSTATYASSNVAWDDTNKREQAQNVTYNVSFARGSDADSDNYILDSSTSATDKYTLTLTQDGSGNNYTGTIKRREVALTMGPVDKIYDGTAANKKSDITSVAGKMGGTNDTAILNDDGITTAKLKTKHEQMMAAGTATSSFGRGTGAGFTENVNASNGTEHDVRYQNIDALFQAVVDAAKKNNYKVDDTVYGKGTINRRLIEKSGFQVRKSDGTIADATKVYDGTSTFALKNGETLVAKTAASGSNTGVVDKDKDNIYFTMTGDNGHFTSDAAGANRTSHKSEANYVAYNVIAGTKNEGVSPLSNYEFGTTASKRNLENVNAENPDAVTADGSIRSAKIVAQGKTRLDKTYDGVTGYTKGDRDVNAADAIGENVVTFRHFDQNGTPVDGLIKDATGTPTNKSTAVYLSDDGTAEDKNVRYAANGKTPVAKAMKYTAKLTGKYADDYEIVDAGNNVISEVGGSGDNKTVTLKNDKRIIVAGAGTISPRTLNITMASVSKVYDTGSANTATNNTAGNPSGTVKSITDEPSSAVIGAILGGDGITKDDLGAAWRALRDHGDAVSDYGHKGNTPFEDENASAAPEGHDVRYTNMDTAFKNQYGMTTAGNYTVASDAYGKGTITPKPLDPNKFSVEDANGHAVPASKTYDGTSGFTVNKDWKIRPRTGSGTGLFDRDANHVEFALSQNGAYFIDKNGNKTAHATNTGTAATEKDAVKASYHVTASAKEGYKHLLKNYTLNGKTLDSGEASVTGEGHIERRTINIGLSEPSGINKVYDGDPKLVNGVVKGKELHHNVFSEADANANVGYATGTINANKLVRTKNGYSVDDGAEVTVEGSYADKNVARDPVTKDVINKTITYKVSIGDDVGKNYTLEYKDGATTHTANAEDGLTLSATGKITPKDLSNAFAPIPDKVYDGTDHVDATKVQFTTGALIAGDDVQLAHHRERYQSKDVNGDGTTWKTPGGTEEKNWVNYSNLSLSGADAKNYQFGSDVRGIGRITPFSITPTTDIDFGGTPARAEKTYDGTRTVKKLVNGVESAASDDVKKYLTQAKVQVGTEYNDLLPYLTVEGTYDSPNVASGEQNVTYKITYKGGNPNFKAAAGTLLKSPTGARGIITKRNVTVHVNSPFTKQYDTTTTVKVNEQAISEDALKKRITLENLVNNENLLEGLTAAYTAENAQGEKNKVVNYTPTFNSALLANYTLTYDNATNHGTYFSTNDNEITKRTVKVKFDHVEKPFDWSSTNKTITGRVFSDTDATVLNTDQAGLVNGDKKLTNQANLNAKMQSKYHTRAGNSESDSDAGGKTVTYEGLSEAMKTTLGDAKAKNYEFVAEDGTGEITQAKIKQADVQITVDPTPATKIYDNTKIVKKNESADKDAVKEYITSATWKGKTLRDVLTVDTATYDSSPNVSAGEQYVTYRLRLNGPHRNFIIDNDTTTDNDVLTAHGKGIITPKEVKASIRHDRLTKTYDATTEVLSVAKTDKTDDGQVVRTGADLVQLNGLVKGDGAGNASTAVYTDKDAGKNNRTIAYTPAIDPGHAGNYRIVPAVPGDDFKRHGNTITPRKLTLGFADGDAKTYDGSSKYLGTKTVGKVVPDNKDGRGKATLDADGITNASFDMTNVDGRYGTGDKDETFQKNADAGAKSVQYTHLKDTLTNTTAKPTRKNNYDIVDTGYGTGRINPRKITRKELKNSISFAPVDKEYDGNRLVKHDSDPTLRDLMQVGTVKVGADTLKDDAGKDIDIRKDLEILNPADTQYDNKDVDGRRSKDRVTYNLKYTGKNFIADTTGDPAFSDFTFERPGDGTITPRDIAAFFKESHISKVYDGTPDLTADNKNAVKKAEQRGIIAGDDAKVTATGSKYMHRTEDREESNKSADDEASARAKSDHSLRVEYRLTLTGRDAGNYTIGTDAHGNPQHTNTVYGTGDIYRRTLTVKVGRKDKEYDGSSTVQDLAETDFTFGNLANRETLNLGDTLNKVAGHYLDSAGNPDANVDPAGNGKGKDKGIRYSGLNAALRSLTGTAENYRLDRSSFDKGTYDLDHDTLTYRAADMQGRIDPRIVSHDALQKGLVFARAEKTYDGTRAVKNGRLEHAYLLDDHGKVLTDLADRFTIDADPTYTHYETENAADTPQRVTYRLTVQNPNLNITGGNTFDVSGTGYDGNAIDGIIHRRKLRFTMPNLAPIKTYDGTKEIVGKAQVNGHVVSQADLDGYVYDSVNGYKNLNTVNPKDGTENIVARDRGRVKAGLLAQFHDKNVEWKDGTWRNKPTGDEKNVDYTYVLSGAGAENYELVDNAGSSIADLTHDANGTPQLRSHDGVFGGKGRIDPYRIELRADSRELRAGEGLPSTFEGTPNGSNYMTQLGDRLSGTIRYTSPAKPFWGDYPINGSYEPAAGETAHKNYYFYSILGTLHVSYYVPDYEYYKALTQTSKMTPDEYAYENASLDRRRSFGRDPEAEIAYTPPSINTIKDGVDITQTGIHVTDETVFSLVNEVFGGK